jgi:hypothetical protein
MQESSYNITTRENSKEAYSAGIAYISLPSDIDRDSYIAECYRSGRVSIYSEHNGFFNRVAIDRYSLNFIKFPDSLKEFGSAVSFVLEPVSKRPVITGIYFKTDELSTLQEHQFSFNRELKGNKVEVTGSPEGKYLHLNVIADEAGEITIKVTSKDQSANINLEVDGDVNITASANTNIRQYNQFNLSTVSPTDSEQLTIFEQSQHSHTFIDNEHNINTDKFSINAGEEPIVLGKKFAEFMKNFIQEVGNSTVTTSLGQMPLLNAEKILEYQKQVKSLLSTIGFIDK